MSSVTRTHVRSQVPSVYLAGQITGLSYDEASAWRNEATDYLTAMGFSVFNPLRDRDMAAPPSYVVPFKRDVEDIKQADYVLAYQLESVGTLIELGMAYAQGKYIVLVAPSTHPFLQGVAGAVVSSLDEAYEELQGLLPTEAGRVSPALLVEEDWLYAAI